ncbi:hypothetical protein [Photobacterium sanguinicancri]|uniref:hypothetical protein n=1 Tax=Photobacterium sanguinicancri TaxID=875932 RepID=UPI0026E3A482|nr:hypothetical protein [Photobacterium sanguinicancri]MDO6499292.1 hypothetical protein [Photobacterium sanguinicancri]
MKKIILASLILLSSSVSAGSLVCTGTVDSVVYHGNDKLMVKLSSMNVPVFICNPNTTWTVAGAEGRVMSSETCKAIFSMFLSARATKENISRVHFDGDNVPSSCSSFGAWQSVFVRMVSY